MKKLGYSTYKLENPVYIIGNGSMAGRKEADGPLGKYFKRVISDDSLGEDSDEKAERRMLEETLFMAIKDAGLIEEQVNLFVGGDLLNQIVSANYTARSFNIPFLGVYGACSTMAESLIIGSMFIDGGFGETTACATTSHFSSSERQFRNPLELGAQRQTYSQWTVTGAGCSILSKFGSGPKITHFTIGNVTDYGVLDIANMGAAMAPVIAIITNPPREVLIKTAPSFMAAKAAASIIPSLSALRGQCIVTTSLRRSSSSKGTC